MQFEVYNTKYLHEHLMDKTTQLSFHCWSAGPEIPSALVGQAEC